MKRFLFLILFFPLLGGCLDALIGEFNKVPIQVVANGNDVIFKFPKKIPITNLTVERFSEKGWTNDIVWSIGDGLSKDNVYLDFITYGKVPTPAIKYHTPPEKLNPGDLYHVWMQMGRDVVEGSFMLEDENGTFQAVNISGKEEVNVESRIRGDR